MAVDKPGRRSECWWWREMQPSNQTIRLETLSLQTLIKHVPQVAKDVGRNIRKKKALRQYFSYSLPVSLQKRLFEKAVENLEDADAILNLHFMFQPFQRLTARNIDLCGKFRYSIDLKTDDVNVTTNDRWSPFYTFHPLTSDQLANLYNLLQWTTDINKLEGISFAVEDDALKKTNLCHVLARAHSLTRVVILKGADNHTLRILGLNCPSLKHLDVTHSWSVSDAGLRNLLLKRPPRLQPNRFHHQIMTTSFVTARLAARRDLANDHLLDKNACATSLEVLILTGTQVTYEGCDFACWCMPYSFLHTMRPIVKIARMKMRIFTPMPDLMQQVDNIVRSVWVLLSPTESIINVCSFQPQTDPGENTIEPVPDEKRISVCYANWPGCFYACLAMKFEGTQLTKLVLPVYSLDWERWHFDSDRRLPLRTLASNFPNLVYFWGCLKGICNEDPLVDRQMIHLQKVVAWGLYSTTVVSILRHCSSLKVLEYNHLDLLERNLNFDILHDRNVLNDNEEFDDDEDNFDQRDDDNLEENDWNDVNMDDDDIGELDDDNVGVDHNNFNAFLNVGLAPRLSHPALENCILVNPSLEETLEEITFRPAKHLGPHSLSLLVEKCHNLRRVGDLETWNLTKEDIEQLTARLEGNGLVPPTFALFNTPPSSRAAEEWDSWIPFE